jgi:DNA end-binding protein Ku
MLELAERILDSKAADFDPATFRDRYEEAFIAHLKARQAGAVRPPSEALRTPRQVINLMEACAGASRRTRNRGPRASHRRRRNGRERHAAHTAACRAFAH